MKTSTFEAGLALVISAFVAGSCSVYFVLPWHMSASLAMLVNLLARLAFDIAAIRRGIPP